LPFKADNGLTSPFLGEVGAITRFTGRFFREGFRPRYEVRGGPPVLAFIDVLPACLKTFSLGFAIGLTGCYEGY